MGIWLYTRAFLIYFLFGFYTWPSFASPAPENRQTLLCGRYQYVGTTVDLSDTEKKLVCGDPSNEAWDNIPLSQATFNLKNFFQDRAYYHPEFSEDQGKILVNVGHATNVTKLLVVGQPTDPEIDFDVSELRHIVGEKLTPSLLDKIKGRFFQKLQSLGYPCPEIDMSANADSGEVTANLRTGTRMLIHSVSNEPVPGLGNEMLRRYDAFQVGDLFNGDYLELTSNRVVAQGIVQNAYFTVTCTPLGAELVQKVVPGPPRVLTFGFGFSTEELAILRASWSHLRLGETGSKVEVTAQASYRIQSLNFGSNAYLLNRPSRLYLRPTLTLKHDLEPNYETLNGDLLLAPTSTWDSADIGVNYSVGPKLNFVKVLNSKTDIAPGTPVPPTDFTFLSFSSDLHITSHYFEYFRASPRSGFDLDLLVNVTDQTLLSQFSAKQFKFSFEKLWNLSHLDPPFMVLGYRLGMATTVADNPLSLPPDFRQWLGGAADLRGFSRQELPDNDGRLTSLFTSVELRFTDLLPWGIQPFTFLDVGATGKRAFDLDLPVYFSPGVGVRLETKIGNFRLMLAHGYITGIDNTQSPNSHWQPYFSFGEEF
jgi:outer membrane translocation and assembly module TamA